MDLLLAAWSKGFSDQHKMTLPSTNLLCDAMDRASPDPERPRHLQDAHALRKLFSHLPFGRTIYLGTAEFHALRYRALETCFDPLADHRPLKLSKGVRSLENELRARSPLHEHVFTLHLMHC